jgi:hypothetical protein
VIEGIGPGMRHRAAHLERPVLEVDLRLHHVVAVVGERFERHHVAVGMGRGEMTAAEQQP